MPLTQLSLQKRYRRNRDVLLRDFYLPCIRNSQQYWRAAGYFSSSILKASTSDLLDLADRGGSIRIVASPHLSQDDVSEIRAAYNFRDKVIERAIEREIDQSAADDDATEAFGILGYLIQRSVLDLKIAIVDDGSGDIGLYHEKFGVFADHTDDFIAFDGSANESINGLVTNFESINVFASWVAADRDRAVDLRDDFAALWSDRTDFLRVVAFPEAATRKLIAAYSRSQPRRERNSPWGRTDIGYGRPSVPEHVSIRSYQKEAITAWGTAGGRGILAMATGAGKTITALSCVSTLFEKLDGLRRQLAVIVTCPFTNLVEQWAHESEAFGITPIKCYLSRATWEPRVRQAIDALERRSVPFLMLITTNDTLRTETFQALLRSLTCDTIFIADEVHNLGAEFNAAALPQHIKLRMGLSATPERWYDELGTSRINDYFGEVIYTFTLEDAIRVKALTPYTYSPIVTYLTDLEFDAYQDVSEQIQRASAISAAEDAGLDDNSTLKLLLIKRARLLSAASNKLIGLEAALEPFREASYNLIYCAEGRAGTHASDDNDKRNIDAALMLVGGKLRMNCDIYTSETNQEERRTILDRFNDGKLQAILAMRCLDEGIDLPLARRAFIMASSSNPRQFIQRRGRILRRAPGKDRAEIFDFIVLPPRDSLVSERFSMERSLVRGELRRVLEFAQLAENGPTALASLLPFRKEYNLLDVTWG